MSAPGANASWRSAAIAAGVAAIVLGLALAPVSESDLYFHLASGRYLAQTGHVQAENTWAFTAPGHPYPPTAWAFDAAAWQLYQQGGFAAVQVGAALLIALAFVLVFFAAKREGAGLAASATVALATAAASVARFTQRPQVVTWCLLAVTALLLREARRSGRTKGLIAVPLVIVVWGQFHAGAVFGVALAGCFAAGALLEKLASRRTQPSWPWLACAAAAAVAMFLNPAGASALANALDHLGRAGVVADIIEFQPPTLEESTAFFAIVAIAALAQVRAWKQLDLTEWLVLGAFAGAAVHERRNLVECLLVIAPPLALRLERLLAPPGRGALRWVAPPAVFLAALAAAPEPLGVFWQRIHLGENPYRIPAGAAAFAREHGVTGRCFSSMDLGGYVEFALPESKVFHDARLMAYPPSLWEALKKAEGDEAAFDALVDQFDVEWSLRSNRNLAYSGVGVFPQSRWALVYSDDAATLRVRRDVPRFAQLIRDYELQEFLPGPDVGEQWAATSGARRERLVTELERSAREQPQMAAAHLGLCFEYVSRKQLVLAEQACLHAAQAIEARRRYEPRGGNRRRRDLGIAWALLAEAHRTEGNVAAARLAFTASLDALPDNPRSLLGLGLSWLGEDEALGCRFLRRAAAAAPDSAPAQAAAARCR